MRLHIGCGRKHLRGWINIDRYVWGYPGAADAVMQARILAFPDNSIDRIFSSHMVEHMLPWEFKDALRTWHRVLKPGGKLSLRCPNFEVYVREWLEGADDYRRGWD